MSLVAVITDFGRRDPYVAEMTLALLREGPPGMTMVEVTHDLEPGAVAAGAWLCGRIWSQLPPGGVLLAVVDPGVGSERPAVAARAGGRFFVGPGNGLAAHLATADDLEVVRLTLRVPSDARAGRHEGAVTIRWDDAGIARIPISLDVLDVSLPDPRDYKFYLDLWQHPTAIARYHRVALLSGRGRAETDHCDAVLRSVGQPDLRSACRHGGLGPQ